MDREMDGGLMERQKDGQMYGGNDGGWIERWMVEGEINGEMDGG